MESRDLYYTWGDFRVSVGIELFCEGTDELVDLEMTVAGLVDVARLDSNYSFDGNYMFIGLWVSLIIYAQFIVSDHSKVEILIFSIS